MVLATVTDHKSPLCDSTQRMPQFYLQAFLLCDLSQNDRRGARLPLLIHWKRIKNKIKEVSNL